MRGLDYENGPDRPARPGLSFAVAAGAVVATALHLVAGAFASFQLSRLAGGISTAGRWTRYGGSDRAWTNVAWVPGGLMLAVGDGGPFALLLLLAGSLLAGGLAATTLVRARRGRRPARYGRYHWRLWACGLAWLGWVPVPVKMTLTYWHTVAY